MIQRWYKKKTQLPLIAIVFVLCTIFYNERRFQEIHRKPNDIATRNDVKKPFSSLSRSSSKASAGTLDRFSTCNSTVKYNGRSNLNTPLLQSDEQENTKDSCNVFSGRWVFDNISVPLYNESDCPYMSDQLACHKHGRPDLMYQNWRWQPHGCDLKRWNATEMWDKLRGKRLMFVGDSLNRGQWISMLCLLESVIPVNKKSITPNAPLTIFRAQEYNATVEFQWAPLIVESNSDDPVNHRLDERIIRPDSVLRHASEWDHVDILVFNSYLWWRQGPVKLLWSNEENGVCEEAESLDAMELATDEWAKWIESNVDPLKKKAFFVTMSPAHLWSREWEPETEGNCYNEKTPIEDERYWGSGSDLPTMRMVGNIVNKLKSKVSVINITQMSEYRKDGHPSIYMKFWESRSAEQLANLASYSDCIHWCLPGVPVFGINCCSIFYEYKVLFFMAYFAVVFLLKQDFESCAESKMAIWLWSGLRVMAEMLFTKE